MKKISQKQLAFYKLYQERKIKPERYVATWEFMGEIYIKEFNRWEFMSYKTTARVSDLFKENPDLLDREWITGKSGVQYYGYRFKPDIKPDHIIEETVKEFYKAIKKAEEQLILLQNIKKLESCKSLK